jgi:hypothetical protein
MSDDWGAWSDKVNKKLARLEGNVAQLQDHFYGTKEDLKENKELAISRLIRAVVWGLIDERKILRDTGTWKPETLYGPGAAVTDRGALWVAQIENKATRPGQDNGCWRLAIKSDVSSLKRAVAEEVRKQVGHAHGR